MRQKKSKFYTFILSFLPGAAEMYMGFMKSGVSLMALFFLSIMIPSVFHMADAFIFIAVLIWFYGFFHARSLAACEEAQFKALPDQYIWEALSEGKKLEITSPTLKKWGAGILIFCGVIMLWESMGTVLYSLIPERWWRELAPLVDMIPQVAVAVLIILIGIKMIVGKKEELNGNEE